MLYKFKNVPWEVTEMSVFTKIRLHEHDKVSGVRWLAPFQTVCMGYTDSLTYRFNLFVLRMCFLNTHHDITVFTGMRRTWLIEIIHRFCCEPFHVGTIYFLLNHTAGITAHAGNVHLLMDERLVTSQEVDIIQPSTSAGWVSLVSLSSMSRCILPSARRCDG